MLKFLTFLQFICPLSQFLKEIPFASFTNAIDLKIERVLIGFWLAEQSVSSQSKSLLELSQFSRLFFFFSDAPSPCGITVNKFKSSKTYYNIFQRNNEKIISIWGMWKVGQTVYLFLIHSPLNNLSKNKLNYLVWN